MESQILQRKLFFILHEEGNQDISTFSRKHYFIIFFSCRLVWNNHSSKCKPFTCTVDARVCYLVILLLLYAQLHGWLYWMVGSIPYLWRIPITKFYKHLGCCKPTVCDSDIGTGVRVWNRLKTFCFADISTFFTWWLQANTVIIGRYVSYSTTLHLLQLIAKILSEKIIFNRIFHN